MVNIKNAAVAYKSLNGLICVYKPSCVSIRQVQHTILTNLCRDLNALPDRELEKRVEIVGATNEPMQVKLVPNYADNPLVCGPRYIQKDFRCSWATHLGLFSSGILLLGINDGTKLTYKINTARPTRAFKVHGQLGKATDTYFWNGRTMERATYKHVTRDKIDKVVAHMQAAHQKTMFELVFHNISIFKLVNHDLYIIYIFNQLYSHEIISEFAQVVPNTLVVARPPLNPCVGLYLVGQIPIEFHMNTAGLSGLHMESQTAYDLASQGLIRPASSNLPIIYGLKCVHFDPPNFTLEIQSVNEYDKYLWTIVHDLSIQLKTAAHCTGVQCIRHGKFDLQLGLLRKHWQLNHILDNMDQCRQLLEENEQLLRPKSAQLTI